MFFPLRETPRFSTEIAPFLYDDLPVSLQVSLRLFPIFYIPFLSPCLFLPVLSKSLPFHLKYLLLPLSFLSFFVFFSLAHSYARVYIIMCSSFSLSFPVSFFMFYNTFANQRLTKKFSFYSKIISDIFCLYCKKVYFCIRLARGAKLLNKKTSKKIWFQCLKVLIFAVRFANRRRFFLCRFFSFRKRAVR